MYTGLNAQETVIYVVVVALWDRLLQHVIAPLPVCVAVIGLIGLVITLRSSK